MISLAIAFISILALRVLFDFQNRARDRQQNVKIDPETTEAAESEVVALDQDETDWQNQRFRYYL
jgi:hypothetical protein